MTDIAPGVATGRTAKTYYQTSTRMSGINDEYTDPVTWNEIALIAGSESFDPGKEASIAGEVRESGRKYQESGVQEGVSHKFTYQRPRGITDYVFDDLLASYAAGGPAYEFAVMDGSISEVGAVGWRFFGEVVGLEHKRDLDKFIEYDVTIEERAVYEVESEGVAAVIQELIPWTVPAPD